MPLTNSMIEQLASWCVTSDVLAEIRSKARSDFFGYDEPGTVKYMAQTGELNARERRFTAGLASISGYQTAGTPQNWPLLIW